MGKPRLHEAAKNGYVEIVRLLLNHGADANARDEKGQTPHALAMANGYKSVADVLQPHTSTTMP